MLPHASLRYIAGIVHRDLQPENILVTSGPDGAVPRIVDIDHRADRFALGMTMFEMLTGGLSAKTRDAPRISARAPYLAVAPELDDLVARLTRRNPAERFASARGDRGARSGVPGSRGAAGRAPRARHRRPHREPAVQHP